MAKKSQRAIREVSIAALRAQCQRLNNQRSHLESINEREDAEPWIGACFRYLNRDSSGKTWWLYIRVVSHDSGNSFKVVQCQSQPGGWHIVETLARSYLLPSPKERGLQRITRRQFDAAWRRFVARIEAVNA